MLQFEAEVLANRTVAPAWKEMALRWAAEAGPPLPGHFVTLRSTRGYDPLLRRPFAIASFEERGREGPAVTILYQVRGPATALLSDLGPGSTVDLLGPLGRPFPDPLPGESPLLAAGGVGLGPVLFLARRLASRGKAAPFAVGFRTASALPDIAFPPGTVLCTDDGSAGERGTPLDWMSHNAPQGAARLLACGPAAMLAAAARLARERGWSASLSAEQWMACGVGVCMGCVLPRPAGAGFLRACADGPVFGLDEIDWEAEARRSAPPAAAAKGGRP
jgi:dihydroorotate dehydrogenase electron transfer subunit